MLAEVPSGNSPSVDLWTFGDILEGPCRFLRKLLLELRDIQWLFSKSLANVPFLSRDWKRKHVGLQSCVRTGLLQLWDHWSNTERFLKLLVRPLVAWNIPQGARGCWWWWKYFCPGNQQMLKKSFFLAFSLTPLGWYVSTLGVAIWGVVCYVSRAEPRPELCFPDEAIPGSMHSRVNSLSVLDRVH